MSEISGQTVSSLAIVEKKPQRPGGCVGIFFQLFDWNRKFAKKKLFSKKLLPPVRLRKSSKKFGGDQKLPKHRLIADENSGGFPHMKQNDGACDVDDEQNNEMRAPGLVARLMGLESMPLARHDKLNRVCLSGAGSEKGEKIIDRHGSFGREELDMVKGERKQELRPQKLQKTGFSERRPVTRFGAEALQLKNVLSRSRKHHQKLVSPVKSPRNVSGRNTSRLVGAAARILEPGLERSRSKCALTYSDAMDRPPPAEAMTEKAIDLEPLKNSYCIQSSVKPLNGQSSSCRNCGHMFNIADVRPNVEERPPIILPVSQFVNPSRQVSEKCNQRLPIFCHQQEKAKIQEDSKLCAAIAMENRQPYAVYMPGKKLINRAGQRQWQPTSQQCKLQKDVHPIHLGHKTQGQNQTFQGRDRLPPRSKISRLQVHRGSSVGNATNERKHFVLPNQNLSDHRRLRMPAKEGRYLDTDQKIRDRRHESLSPVRKRRSVNSSSQNEGPTFSSSSFAKSTNTRFSEISGKDRHYSSDSATASCTNNRLAHSQECVNADSGKNSSDVICFTFKSPMKHETGIHADTEGRMNQNGPDGEVTRHKSVLNGNGGKRSSLKSFPLSGDSLGALLEQKLKELTCQLEEDSTSGDTTPKKTTAMILQDLISALTTERPSQRDDLSHGVNNGGNCSCIDGQQSKKNAPTTSQAKPKLTKNSVGYLPNCEHLSPGSVLEASFSNDSCASSSLDDGSSFKLGVESTECCEGPHLLDPEADLLDSASSLSMGKVYRESVTYLLNNISQVFTTTNLVDVHLKGSKLIHAKEVILNAELVFGNSALPDAVVKGGFSISRFVLNELEMLASVMWRNFGVFVAFNTNEGNQLKGFVFDCVIEYLESRFSRYSNSGFNAWTRLPLRMKTEMLICEIVKEVGRWAEFAGLITDELIEHEMSHSLGKWTDFELETFETGIEIDQQILQNLIAEIVVDFTGCNPICS